MNILKIIGEVFKPAAKLIDDLHTSTEEKLTAKATLLQLQADFLEKGLDFEATRLKEKARIITAEASSGNLLTSSWRPVTMYTFLIMLVSWWFGWIETPANATPEVLEEIFSLLKIGIGGYIGSRGVEKVVPKIVKKPEEV
jgi:hypothetical protein